MCPTVETTKASCVLLIVETIIVVCAWERLKTRKVGHKLAHIPLFPNVPDK